MSEPLSDKLQTETLDKIVLNHKTVNEYDDPSLLSPDHLMQADNVIFDKGSVEKIPGTLKINSDSGNYPVYGLHRSYGKDGTKKTLRLANGKLQDDPPAFGGTSLLTGLTSVRTPFIDIQNRTYGVNPTDGIIKFDPLKDQASLVGVVGPQLRKKIAFFEADETWVKSYGLYGAIDTNHFRADEFSGNSMQSIKIGAASGGYSTVVYSYINLDLSTFSNGKISSMDDMIVIKTMVQNWSCVAAIQLILSCSSGTFTINLDQKDIKRENFEWQEWKIKKSAFIISGTPSWDSIITPQIGLISTSLGDAYIWVDSIYLKNAPPKAVEMRRQIASGNTSDGFSGTGVSIDNEVFYEDNSSLKFVSTGAGTITAEANPLGTQIDLSTWPNGVVSLTSDEIVFQIYVKQNGDTYIDPTNPLILKLGQSNTVYWSYTWANKTLLGIILKKAQWVEVRIAKSAFTAGATGITTWEAIDYCSIAIKFGAASTPSGSPAYIDDVHMEPFRTIRQIATFESPAEVWTITNNGQYPSSDAGGVVQGASCLKLWGPKTYSAAGEESSALIDWTGGVKDLSTFDGTVVSGADDYISFHEYHQHSENITQLEIWFDAASGPPAKTFAVGYKYVITPDMMEKGANKGKYIEIKKSDFEEIGSPGGWASIGACKFVIIGKGANNPPSLLGGAVSIDDLILKRKKGNTGRYYFKYAFLMRDVSSALSGISEKVDVKGSFISVSNIATSQDSRVTARRLYIMGGSYPSTWMRAATIEDNTTTSFVYELSDSDLIYPLGDEVPQGFINNVLCSNLNYDPQSDRALYWGDQGHKNRIYASHAGYYHVVDETGYRELPDDVIYVQPWYGQQIIWFRHKMMKIVGDPMIGELIDLPVSVGAVSYYGVKKVSSSLMAFAGWDNVYLFDGYKVIPIGDEVKNYFINRETYLQYMEMGYVRDTLYLTCRNDVTDAGYNDTVLRYHIPKKGWSVIPSWNVNCWSNWDKQNDQNEFYYGDSFTKNILKVDYSLYSFNAGAISSIFGTGWINNPEGELALHHIELKAKGTLTSVLIFKAYTNYLGSIVCTGSITFPATELWRTYRIGPKNIWNLVRGDAIKIEFLHSTNSSYFKVKDIVIYTEKLSKRAVFSEVTVT